MDHKTVQAILAAEAIIKDIRSRSGMEQMWDECDEATRDEIKDEWVTIILNGIERCQ